MTAISSETLHASCVAIDARAVLISGRSGTGKSDLALRLIDRGAVLVSDDYTILQRREGKLIAQAPATIAGQIEVRGVGILTMPHETDSQVMLVVVLGDDVERLPDRRMQRLAGVEVPELAVRPFEASAPIKVELALARLTPPA